MEGRNLYQLGLAEGRIVRLLAADSDRRPVAVTYDDLRQVLYWTDVAEASIVSRQLTHPNVIARPITVYTAGRICQFALLLPCCLRRSRRRRKSTATSTRVWTRRKLDVTPSTPCFEHYLHLRYDYFVTVLVYSVPSHIHLFSPLAISVFIKFSVHLACSCIVLNKS